MNILSFFRTRKAHTASIAKERLQIIVSHRRVASAEQIDFLPRLQEELMEVIARYIPVHKDQVKFHLGKEGEFSVLELNVPLIDPGQSGSQNDRED